MLVRMLVGLLYLATLIASGQTTRSSGNLRPLSLQECIDLALSRNLDVQIQRLTTAMVGYNLDSAYGAYSPVFSFDARRGYVSEPANFDAEKFNPDFPAQIHTDTFGPALSGQLPFGLSYDMRALAVAEDAASDFRGDPDHVNDFPGGIRRTNNFLGETRLTVRQHLLKDFWIDSARQTLLVRRKELGMSQQALRFQIMKTVLAVEMSYYDLIAAREMVGVQEKSLELHQQLVDETKRRVEVGDLPPLDAEQAETQLQNTLTALTGAREGYQSRQNALKRLLTDHFRQWAEVEVQPTEVLLALPTLINRSESFSYALEHRPDLSEARLAVEQRAVVVRFQRNQLFPSLDLVGRYGGAGVDNDYGSALNQAFGVSYPDYFYGVVLSFPLDNATARGTYRASRAAKQIAELQLQKAEEEVLLQIADYVNRVQSRFSQVSSTRKARSFAEAALAAEQKKLRNGLSTTFFVLQLEQTLTQARTAELQAVTDYNRTLAQLAFAEGKTLERHHLEVKGR